MIRRRHLAVMNPCLTALLGVGLISQCSAQDTRVKEVTVKELIIGNVPGEEADAGPDGERADVQLTVVFYEDLDNPLTGQWEQPEDGDGGWADPDSERARFWEYLLNEGNYKFVAGWPGSENEVDTSTEADVDNVFRLKEAWFDAWPGKPVPEGTPGYGEESFEWQVLLDGSCSRNARGLLVLEPPPEGSPWKLKIEPSAGEDGKLLWCFGTTWELPSFRAKADIGLGEGNWVLNVTGSGVLNEDVLNGRLETLSVSAKIPLGNPDDVESTPGADDDASAEVSDAISIAWNRTMYRRGGKLSRLGIRGRATGSLEGWEGVVYWQP